MKGKPYLDMQMWYSAVNFGYKNKEIESAHALQMERLPQIASQYLHKEKILLAAGIARETEKRFGEKGRVHFNVGGAQAIEDSLKLVRMNQRGKSLMIAFMGGYHGRTLAATEITSSYRYRKKYGHFGNRALFIPFPYCYRCIYDKKYPACEYYCAGQFKKLFETEYYGIVDKEREAEFASFLRRTGSGDRRLYRAVRPSISCESQMYSSNMASYSLMMKFRWAFTAPAGFGRWSISGSGRMSLHLPNH